jgi:hypothetical protein
MESCMVKPSLLWNVQVYGYYRTLDLALAYS